MEWSEEDLSLPRGSASPSEHRFWGCGQGPRAEVAAGCGWCRTSRERGARQWWAFRAGSPLSVDGPGGSDPGPRVEGGGPELRRTVLYQGVAVGQYAVARLELRELLIEVEGFIVNDLARVEVDDHSAQALRAGIQSEE